MEKRINLEMYQEGIFDICDFINSEMKSFLIKENRYKFKVQEYHQEMKELFKKTHKGTKISEINIYGRVLFNIIRSMRSEYIRLREKKLSCADCLVCMSLKLIEISEKYENPNFKFKQEQNELKNILIQMFENIKHKAKYYKFKKLDYFLTESIDSEKWGTFSLDELDFVSLEKRIDKVRELSGERQEYTEQSYNEITL